MALRLLILENNLRERLGHFLNSTIGLADAAIRSGHFDRTQVYCNRRANKEIIQLTGATPIFEHVSWKKHWRLGARESMECYGARFASDCRRIANLDSDDILMVPTALENQVYGIALLLESLPENGRPQVVLNFHMDDLLLDPIRARATQYAFERLANACSKPAIISAPTPELVDALDQVSGSLKATLFPLPMDYGEPAAGTEITETSDPATIAILGRPLSRKGSTNVVKIIRRVLKAAPDTRFLIQATARVPSQLLLVASSRVTVFFGGLSPQEYGATMKSANIVLLPYSIDAYKDRTSGVFADGAAHGKIAVVPSGTWMARQIQNKLAAGVIYDHGSSHCISEAILQTIDKVEHLQSSAQDRSDYWWNNQSAASYIRQLVSELHTEVELPLLRTASGP
jgi:hypothetical protein